MSGETRLLEALQRPEAYPWPVADVQLISTHISRVFLAGDRVIKLKRPVRYSFVDYSTLDLRHQACLDEVRLNRLLSDDIYLGVVPIVRDGNEVRVGSDDEADRAIEWVTLMRRIDDDDVLDARLERDAIPADLATRLADRLVPFHLSAARQCGGEPNEVLEAQERVVLENLDELRPFARDTLPEFEFDMVDRAMRSFLADRREQMLARIGDGWVREGHGDLRCEHVVVPDEGPVQVFDCVEFNRDLRCADIASDIAFLLMDLVRLGAGDAVVRDLLSRYADAGAALPASLLRFFWIHRALVRAKVHCLRLADLAEDERAPLVRKVVDYLHIATRQAVTMRPAFIAMTGLSGTGKSTVARAIARATGATFFDTDIIRKDPAWLAGDEAQARGEDIYTAEWTQRTYDRMIGEGSEIVGQGGVAILDGTFLERALRDQAADAARELGVPFAMVEVRCDDEVVLKRLEARQRDPRRTSDAGVDIHLRQRERHRANPPGLPEGTIHSVVDTTPDGPASLDSVLQSHIDAGFLTPGIRKDDALV